MDLQNQQIIGKESSERPLSLTFDCLIWKIAHQWSSLRKSITVLKIFCKWPSPSSDHRREISFQPNGVLLKIILLSDHPGEMSSHFSSRSNPVLRMSCARAISDRIWFVRQQRSEQSRACFRYFSSTFLVLLRSPVDPENAVFFRESNWNKSSSLHGRNDSHSCQGGAGILLVLFTGPNNIFSGSGIAGWEGYKRTTCWTTHSLKNKT